MKLKLVLYSFPEGHTFTFTNPGPVATAEREQFKNEITNHISRNRTARASGQLPTDASATPATPATPNNFAAPPSRTPTKRPPGGTPRASSVASDRSGSGNDVADFQLRKRVLLNSPELATLHRELVMTGQITENEFWDGREVHKYNLYRFLTFVSDGFRHEASIVCTSGHGESEEREIRSTRRSSSTDR